MSKLIEALKRKYTTRAQVAAALGIDEKLLEPNPNAERDRSEVSERGNALQSQEKIEQSGNDDEMDLNQIVDWLKQTYSQQQIDELLALLTDDVGVDAGPNAFEGMRAPGGARVENGKMTGTARQLQAARTARDLDTALDARSVARRNAARISAESLSYGEHDPATAARQPLTNKQAELYRLLQRRGGLGAEDCRIARDLAGRARRQQLAQDAAKPSVKVASWADRNPGAARIRHSW